MYNLEGMEDMDGTRFVSRGEAEIINRYWDAEDFGADSAYWTHYAALGLDEQARVGYVLAGFPNMPPGDFCSPPQRAYARFLKKAPVFVEPFCWLGWGGENANLGPVYRIEPLCFPYRDPVLFYADDTALFCADGADRRAALEEFAHSVVEASSGLAFAGTGAFLNRFGWEGLTGFVAFRLDFFALKPQILVNRKPRAPECAADAFAIALPRGGEFCCMLGEAVPRAPGDMGVISLDGRYMRVILSTGSYCLK